MAAQKPPARPATPARPQPVKPQGKPPATNGAARPASQAARPATPARPAQTTPPPARTQAPRPQTVPRPTRQAPPPPVEEQQAEPVYDEQGYSDPAAQYADPAYADQGDNYDGHQDAPPPVETSPPPPARPAPRPAAAARPQQAPRPAQPAQPARPATVPAVARAPSGLVGVSEGVRYDQLPDYMREDVHGGKGTIESEDLGIVQYKLMQATSPELTEREDLRPGDFLHTGSGRNMGPVWHAAFLHYQRQYILWNPLESGGGILARAADGKHWNPPDAEWQVTLDKKDGGHAVTWRTARTVAESKLHLWGTMNPYDSQSPPAATKMLTFIAVPWEYQDDGPAILTFQRSSLKRGSNLLTKIRMQRAPLYGVVYKISSYPDTNKNNQQYMNQKAEAVGLINDQAIYDQFKALNMQFAESGFELRDIESLQDEPLPEGEAGYDGDEDGAGDVEGQPRY